MAQVRLGWEEPLHRSFPMPGQPLTVILSDSEQQDLQRLVNRRSTPQQLAQRARIVLLAADGLNNAQVAHRLSLSIKMARQWRRRWVETACSPLSIEKRLQDSERSGAPPKFTLQQQVACIAMACRDPREYSRPISHWTNRELADELCKQGIVERISPRQVGRWLQEAELKPHQSRYWLFPP